MFLCESLQNCWIYDDYLLELGEDFFSALSNVFRSPLLSSPPFELVSMELRYVPMPAEPLYTRVGTYVRVTF